MSGLLDQTILANEMRVLDGDVRRNPTEVARLVSPDFREHCSSGKVYRYAHGDTFGDSSGGVRNRRFIGEGVGSGDCSRDMRFHQN